MRATPPPAPPTPPPVDAEPEAPVLPTGMVDPCGATFPPPPPPPVPLAAVVLAEVGPLAAEFAGVNTCVPDTESKEEATHNQPKARRTSRAAREGGKTQIPIGGHPSSKSKAQPHLVA